MSQDVSYPGYERYWQHFNFVQSWIKKHKQVTQDITQNVQSRPCTCGGTGSAQNPARFYHSTQQLKHGATKDVTNQDEAIFKVPPVPPGFKETGQDNHIGLTTLPARAARTRPYQDDDQKPKAKRKKKKKSSRSRSSSASSAGRREGFKAEISEDFVEFMRKSAAHKQEREAKKTKESAERMEVDSQGYLVDASIRKAAPTEQPGMRRTHEIKMLYGDRSHQIHGMETAQQLSFQQACDKMKPQHWPNIPLKLRFT